MVPSIVTEALNSTQYRVTIRSTRYTEGGGYTSRAYVYYKINSGNFI
jgi:hypothetical protein